MTLAPRTGVTGYCAPYDPAGVKKLAGDRIRLTATKTRSAGLLGPFIKEPCRVTVEVTGALHALHPLAVFAVWTYDDSTKNEVDLIEATRWGDRNNPYLYYLTSYAAGVKDGQVKFLGRAFNRHKIVSEFGVDGKQTTRVYGWWQGREWKEVASYTSHWWPGQLRIALWTHQEIEDALGPCSVVVERVDVSPL
jgi:hypothetical protein